MGEGSEGAGGPVTTSRYLHSREVSLLFAGHMGIDHGGLQIGMAEQFLDAKWKSDFSRPEAYENSSRLGL
jgi:hypothetical protein